MALANSPREKLGKACQLGADALCCPLYGSDEELTTYSRTHTHTPYTTTQHTFHLRRLLLGKRFQARSPNGRFTEGARVSGGSPFDDAFKRNTTVSKWEVV